MIQFLTIKNSKYQTNQVTAGLITLNRIIFFKPGLAYFIFIHDLLLQCFIFLKVVLLLLIKEFAIQVYKRIFAANLEKAG
jgi:hypothetical protein